MYYVVLPLFASTPFMIMFILFSGHCTMQWCFDRIMIHYLKNKVGVVDYANAQGVVMF